MAEPKKTKKGIFKSKKVKDQDDDKLEKQPAILTDDELKAQVEELKDLIDISKLDSKQKQCVAKIIACFVTNHIHRYERGYELLAKLTPITTEPPQAGPSSTKAAPVVNSDPAPASSNANKPVRNTASDETNADNMAKTPDADALPTTKPTNTKNSNNPPSVPQSPAADEKTIPESKDDEEDNTPSKEEIDIEACKLKLYPSPCALTLLNHAENQPQPSIPDYTSLSSTNNAWAVFVIRSFCEHLKLDATQIEGYLFYLERSFIDPTPIYEAMQWSDKTSQLRIPLLLLQFAISHKGWYDAKLRSLVKSIVTFSDLGWNDQFVISEYSFGVMLHILLQKKAAKSNTNKYGRWAKIGAAGVVSGALIAVTGGLAAPAVAAGLGAIGLTAGGTFLLTTTGTATLYLLFGATGAGFAGYKMHHTVGEIKDFEFKSLSSCNALNVVIGVSGWLESKHGDGGYWSQLFTQNIPKLSMRADCYALQFEKEAMMGVGKGLNKFLGDQAVKSTVSNVAKTTACSLSAVAATLIGALAWPFAVLAVAGYIDNPWAVGFSKSKEAGLILADCLASGNHGRRPVTLVGYSLGARVIYYALQELLRRQMEKGRSVVGLEEEEELKQDVHRDVGSDKEETRKASGVDEVDDVKKDGGEVGDETDGKKKTLLDKLKGKKKEQKKVEVDLSGIVENVILLGGPLPCDVKVWTGIRKLVSDRIFNLYSTNDWVLKFVYRSSTGSISVAGLMPIPCQGIENIDISELIEGHQEYSDKTPEIMEMLVEDYGLLL